VLQIIFFLFAYFFMHYIILIGLNSNFFFFGLDINIYKYVVGGYTYYVFFDDIRLHCSSLYIFIYTQIVSCFFFLIKFLLFLILFIYLIMVTSIFNFFSYLFCVLTDRSVFVSYHFFFYLSVTQNNMLMTIIVL